LNNFVFEYEKLRKTGRNPYEAFGTVAGLIAFKGTIDDLQDLYFHHHKDEMNEVDRKLAQLEVEQDERVHRAV